MNGWSGTARRGDATRGQAGRYGGDGPAQAFVAGRAATKPPYILRSPVLFVNSPAKLQPNEDRNSLLEVLDEVSTLMSAEHVQLGPLPDDHPLAQSGLENGAEIVLTTSRTARQVSHLIICFT